MPAEPRSVPPMPPSASELQASYARCRRLHRAHGTTYYWATRALPRADQPHVHALYGLCRYADEIVDAPDRGSLAQRAATLTALRGRFDQDMAAGHSDHPVLAAVIDTVHRLSIDPELLRRFFASMHMDLSVSTYRTHAELERYMDGSAAVIGELMLPVLRPPDPVAARDGARALGVAFQLTNFLRDVDEDLDRGRIYLPLEDLERFGADPRRRVADASWRAFSRFQIARIRAIYREADAGIDLLPPRSAKVIRAARVLYSGILERIEDADYDVFAARARIATPVKVAVVGRELMRRTPTGSALHHPIHHPAHHPPHHPMHHPTHRPAHHTTRSTRQPVPAER